MRIDLSTPVLCILLCVGSGVGWLLWKKANCKFRFWNIPFFVFYILAVLKITVFPISIFSEETLTAIWNGSGKYFQFYQLVPFASIRHYFQRDTIIQLVGNILLLAPLAVFLEIFLCQRPKAWKVVLLAASASLLIEVTQLLCSVITRYPDRLADVDDLLLNTIGIVVTILLTRFIGRSQKVRKAFQKLLYR